MYGLIVRQARAAVAVFWPSEEAASSLRTLAVRSSVWSLAGYGLAQVLRLAGNLLFTRLLAPEMFGVMTLVTVVVQGMGMLSDVGINASIVQHPRGEEPAFIQTAWTLQILRGVLQWLLVCALAWPLALVYGEPKLLWLLPVCALALPIQALGSMAPVILHRRVRNGRVVLLDLQSQVAVLICIVLWALIDPSIRALVAGMLVGSLVRTLLSYRLLPGLTLRVRWDRDCARELIRFGRWIVIATAMTFLMNQGDRIVLGKILDARQLGIYSIAFFLSSAIGEAARVLSSSVLLPVYSRLASASRAEFRAKLFKVRLTLLCCALPPVCLMAVFGKQLVHILYDQRYAEAGWMIQVLAIGTIGVIVQTSVDCILLAVGDSFRHMLLQSAYALLLFSGLFIGAQLDGLAGILIGASAARVAAYVPMVALTRRYGVWLPKLDVAAFGLCAVFIFLLRHALHT